MTKTAKIVNFLFEVGTLRKIPRAHMQTLYTGDLSDNIASHSYRVTIIGWLLATDEKADVNKVIQMCLLHDTGEARSGDQNWVHKKYVKTYEDEIANEQLSGLPFTSSASKIYKEYSERKTNEAKIAKDADLIDQILLLREYEWTGSKEAKRWLDMKAQKARLHTKKARKWVDEISTQNPSEWWNNLWTSKRR